RLKAIERSSNSILRILVDNGGCSGFQYKFELTEEPTPSDRYVSPQSDHCHRVIEQDGVRVIVDDVSLGLIEGSTLDYEDELIRSGFRITKNPQAEKGCSCGVSFALKMD
ncbi:iron-sulfur cluster assembly accessory protein, partial [Opisthorchis viverrini]